MSSGQDINYTDMNVKGQVIKRCKRSCFINDLSFNQQERLDIEEKYTSLQEEAQGKTKKLKKVWTMLMAAKSEVSST